MDGCLEEAASISGLSIYLPLGDTGDIDLAIPAISNGDIARSGKTGGDIA